MLSMTDSEQTSCADCGASLSDAPDPCPTCGSRARHIRLTFSDTATAKARDTLKGKVKDPTRRSKDKVRREFFYGADARKSQGDYVYKEREIDRDNDRYRELVKEESGDVLRDVDGRLSDHIGHGSAKFKAGPKG